MIALVREMARLVDNVKMWTTPYGSTQVTLGIDGDWEVTTKPRSGVVGRFECPRSRSMEFGDIHNGIVALE